MLARLEHQISFDLSHSPKLRLLIDNNEPVLLKLNREVLAWNWDIGKFDILVIWSTHLKNAQLLGGFQNVH